MTNWNGLELPESYFHDDDVYIIKGDSAEILADFPEKCVDLTVTSPPYDNLRDYNKYSFDFERIAEELYRTHKDGGVVVWVVGDATIKGSETGTSFKQALYFRECGFNLHDTMIWDKGSFTFPSTNRYHQVFEYMFVLSKGKPKSLNMIKDRKNRYSRMGGISGRNKDGSRRTKGNHGNKLDEYGQRFNIWWYTIGGGHVASDDMAHNHPAVFPETLANDHILSWSKDSDIVLDPFLGSGTTMKMAVKNNRRCIGIEISEEYCELSAIRYLRSLND